MSAIDPQSPRLRIVGGTEELSGDASPSSLPSPQRGEGIPNEGFDGTTRADQQLSGLAPKNQDPTRASMARLLGDMIAQVGTSQKIGGREWNPDVARCKADAVFSALADLVLDRENS